MKKIIAAALLPLSALAMIMLGSPAGASTRWHAYEYARHQTGCWYHYGSAGPCSDGYDCSGLVYRAYRSAGVWLPRTTYEMLASRKLVRVPFRDGKMGDLVFYGSGHVELWHWRHSTLGALETGTRVGFHHWYAGSWWRPTAVYHVRGTG